jgi:hypothetical protein
MTTEELFDELANCFAVMVDHYPAQMSYTSQLCHPQYYCPEDRCGDDTQPMVEMLYADLCIEPSDIISISCSDYIATIHIKGLYGPITLQFLECKKLVADPMDQEDPSTECHTASSTE